MIFHGFAFLKFAKPVYEHHLQVGHRFASLVQSHLSGLLKRQQKPNGFDIFSYLNE
jgi:hypothetical protein